MKRARISVGRPRLSLPSAAQTASRFWGTGMNTLLNINVPFRTIESVFELLEACSFRKEFASQTERTLVVQFTAIDHYVWSFHRPCGAQRAKDGTGWVQAARAAIVGLRFSNGVVSATVAATPLRRIHWHHRQDGCKQSGSH